MPVNMRDPASGETYVVDDGEVAARLGEGWTSEDATGRVDRVTSDRLADEYGGVSGAIAAGGAGILRGATAGLSDAAFAGLGEGDEIRNLREQHAGLSTGTEILGAVGSAALSGGSSLAATTPAGLAARAGSAIAHTAEGAGLAARAGRLVAGGAVEGAIDTASQAITQASLYDDPLDIETLGSQLFTNMALGAGANVAGAAAGKALRRAKGKLDDVVARGAAQADGAIASDLSKLDAKGLRTAEKAELAAIEEGRVTQRTSMADEIKAHRSSARDDKLFLATKDAKTWEGVAPELQREMGVLGKRTLKADQQLDRLLDNPKALQKRPQRALEALQQQESALEELLAKRTDLETVYKADKTPARMKALDGAQRALERNRDLQVKLEQIAAAPSSQRLDDIVSARDALSNAPKETFASKMAGGSAYSLASSIVSAVPIIGPLAAPLIGAAASNAVTGKLGGKLAEATAAAAARASKAVDTFLDVGKKIAPAAPVLATRVFQAVRKETAEEKPNRGAKRSRTQLAELYKGHADDVRRQTVYVDGAPKMRPEARQKVAAQIAPLALQDPILADKLETLAARRVEFLSKKIPRRPDIASVPIGPDTWQPSDMEMRSYARTVAAVEDPHGVIERLASGAITPEDAEALREVYPEMMADVTRQILERLPELRKNLPFERRLALSIFTGVAVDPAMDPGVLSVLQASFSEEPGTEGGTQAPKPMPQFGSVKTENATPSQQRNG